MFELKPFYEPERTPYNEENFFFHGKHFLFKQENSKNTSSFTTMPIGHCQHYPVQFENRGVTRSYNQAAKDWLAEPLIHSVVNKLKTHATIDVKRGTTSDNVVVLNCLDDCFGHVIHQVLNIDKYKNGRYDIIILIHQKHSYYIPDYVHEIWEVSANPIELFHEIQGLDDFIKTQLKRFKKVFLDEISTQPNVIDIPEKDFTKVQRFDLNQYSDRSPQITFILRNDRFWHGGPIDEFLYLLSLKFGLLKYSRAYFEKKQLRLVKKTVRQILKTIPNAHFFLTGVTTNNKTLPLLIGDLRTGNIKADTERKWNETYSKSHLVIGVHGSSMVIPSWLAAGFIILMPKYKVLHITEDTLTPYSNRLLLFLGRYLDISSKPNLVALHATTMIRRCNFYQKKLGQV